MAYTLSNLFAELDHSPAADARLVQFGQLAQDALYDIVARDALLREYERIGAPLDRLHLDSWCDD